MKLVNAKPRLLDRMRETVRLHQYSIATERVYLHWVKRFILFHDKQHPETMGKKEIEGFLTHLAVNRQVAPSTQNVALESGTDIRTIQQLPGHNDLRTTMIYTHVVERGALGARSPLDR